MGMYFYGLYRIHHIGYRMAQGHLWGRGGGSRLGGSREEGSIHRGRRAEWSVKEGNRARLEVMYRTKEVERGRSMGEKEER